MLTAKRLRQLLELFNNIRESRERVEAPEKTLKLIASLAKSPTEYITLVERCYNDTNR